MSPSVVKIENVKKIFKRGAEELEVLHSVNLSLAQGDFLTLVGPSGSGKTTILNLVAGLDRPTSGNIVVAGADVTSLREPALARWRARHIGFIFQLYNLIPVLSAFENVELPLLLTKLSKRERREHVMTALAVVDLTDRVKHLPRQLSGGEEQRVAIARAIVTDPTLIVADEPTGDLDARSADEILKLLKRLNEEFDKTILMVTHDPRAARYAHSKKHLDKGVLTDFAPEESGDMRS